MAEVRLYVVFMWFSALFIWHVFCYFDLILLFIKSIISRISFLYFYVQLLCTLLRVLVFRFYCGPIPHLVVCFLLFYFCHSFNLKCLQLCRSLFLFIFFGQKHTWKTWKGQKTTFNKHKIGCGYQWLQYKRKGVYI